ncbi:MAG: hypothetical protein QG639_269 [Patescibacteria group bacterium]|nr:hypothetical protein [Patescibacteria group bacterium]
MMTLSRKRLTAYSYLLINTLVWGAAFIVVKPAFEAISPFNFLFSRYALAGLLCVPVLVYYFRKIHISFTILKTIILLELVGTTLNLGVLYLGLARTSAIETSLITTTAPLFTVLMGIFFLKERQQRNEWSGMLLSFGGMLLITLLPILSNGFVSNQASLLGNLLIVAANISESGYYIAAKKQYKRLPKLFVASLSFFVGTVSFGLLSLWQSNWSVSTMAQELMVGWQFPPAQFAIIYMAVFGSIVGLTMYIKGQDSIEASEASIFRYLQPAVYLPLGMFLLGETISVWQIVGLALIIVGFITAEVRRKP